jgi:stage II sporulation protein P
MNVTLTDGKYVITQESAPEGGKIYPGTSEILNGNDYCAGQRLYTSTSHDFADLEKEAYIERNPLTAKNIKLPTIREEDTLARESFDCQQHYTEAPPRFTEASLIKFLEEKGIGVVHDRSLHDAESYSGSYESARTAAKTYLERYPSIRLVLDLHRDAAEDAQGNQINYTFPTKKGAAAKLVFVVGTDAGGQNHPVWQENLSLALKLQAALQRRYPDSCRPVQLRPSRYNQDLLPGFLLVEVGAAGNTRQEAMLAAEVLVEAILELAGGANLQ